MRERERESKWRSLIFTLVTLDIYLYILYHLSYPDLNYHAVVITNKVFRCKIARWPTAVYTTWDSPKKKAFLVPINFSVKPIWVSFVAKKWTVNVMDKVCLLDSILTILFDVYGSLVKCEATWSEAGICNHLTSSYKINSNRINLKSKLASDTFWRQSF